MDKESQGLKSNARRTHIPQILDQEFIEVQHNQTLLDQERVFTTQSNQQIKPISWIQINMLVLKR